jgi:hypothetical protein
VESMFETNMAREADFAMMIQDHQTELREIARVANMVRQSRPIHLTWYCPLLVRLGNALIAFGTHLKTRYSIQPMLHARESESIVRLLR